jgi:hypothetical protein
VMMARAKNIYWCPAPLPDEDQRNYKIRDVADVQEAPPPPVDEYVSDSTVGSDNEAPATLRRAPSNVAAPWRTRQTIGKIPNSRPRPRLRRRRRGAGSGPDPWCLRTPPLLVLTSRPSTLKMTRATCSHQKQQRLCRQEGRLRRRLTRRWGPGALYVRH